MDRQLRLHRNADFQRLRRDGLVKRHPDLLLSYIPNNLPHNRYGFITAKRLGKAVVRNRIRRLLREAVRLHHPQVKPGYDMVFIARPAIVGKPFDYIQRIVYELSRRAGILNKEPDI